MQVSSDVKTEYLNNQGQVSGPKKDPAKIGNQLNGSSTSVEQKQNTSNIDKLIEKVCAEFSKLGLTPEKLKQSNLIKRVSGMNEAQIENASEQDLNRIFECIKTAIKDVTVNGQVDLDKAIKLANDYHIALIGGWDSIESFKNKNKNFHEDISTRMEKFFGLKAGSFATLPQEKIEEYLKRYFEGYFLERVKKSNNPKREYKIQLQDFTKLLINTPDEQKGVFRQALISLQASNRVKGLDAVLKSFDTQQARTEWADSCDTKFTKAFATKADCEGNVPEQKDVTAAVAKLTEQKSEEGIRTHQEQLQKEATEFFKENKEALEKIREKEIKQEPLTEEEKQLVLLRDNYFTAAKAGEITGTALNQIIDASVRDILLDKMNRDAYELPIYKEVITHVTEFVKQNPDALALSREELTKLLDKVTNGNYSEILNNGDNATIKAPAVLVSDKGDAASTETGYGLAQNQSAEQIAAIKQSTEEKTAQIIENSDEKETVFEVEKSTPTTASQNYIKAQEKGVPALVAFFKKTKDTFYKKVVAKKVAKDQNRVTITNNGGNELAIYVNQAKRFTQEEIKKLTCISGIVKNAMGASVIEEPEFA